MTAAILAGMLAGYGIAIPIGAVAPYLMAVTARNSLRVGVGGAMGIATADGVYALVAMAGGSAIAALVRPVAEPLRWLSVLLLVAVAARIAWAGIQEYRAHQVVENAAEGRPEPKTLTTLRAYLLFLGITILNPATIVYFVALVVGDQNRFATPPTATAFVVAAFVASASWQLVIAGGGAALGRFLAGVRGRLATALLSFGLIIAMAGHLLFAG